MGLAENVDQQKTKASQIFLAKDIIAKTQKTADSFQNFAAKLGVGPGFGRAGTEDNLISKGHYDFNLVTRNRVQLEAAYRGSWIVGQVVDTIAQDMTRAGIEISTNEGAEQIDELKVKMSQLQIWQSLCRGIKWSRLYGGAIIVVQIDGQKLNTPLNIDSVGKDQFKGLTVYDRWQIYPVLTDLITSGPDMGLPACYDIVLGTNLNDPGMEPGGMRTDESSGRVRVHHSRCIRMIGIELPFFQAITEMLWGESVLERMWDRLIAFDDATMNTAGLIHRALLRTVGIKGLREILAAGGEAQAALVAQFDMMRELQSNEGITLLDEEDEFATTAYTFAGLSDVLIQIGQQVSGAAEIPLVRLFGQSPAGMNATGEADLRLYYDGVNAKQESKMRNPMEAILKIMWRSLTGNPAPKDLAFSFTPLWQMSAIDKANIAKTNTDTIVEAHQEGAIDTATMMKELKQTSGDTGLFTHITDEAIEEAKNDLPPEPELEQPENKADAVGEPGEGPHVPSDKTGDSAWIRIKKWLNMDAGFKEDDHPRKENGEFGKGSGGSESAKIKSDKLVAHGDVGILLRENSELFKKLGEEHPELKSAVYEWSRASYQYVRRLQQGKKLNKDEKQLGEEVLNGLDKHFEKLPIFEGPISRDLAFDDYDGALKVFKPGDTFETDAYSSFTAKEGYSKRNCRMIIEKNTKGRAAWGLAQAKDEAEVLIPKGQKYTVDRVKENEDGPPYVIVYLKESSDE